MAVTRTKRKFAPESLFWAFWVVVCVFYSINFGLISVSERECPPLMALSVYDISLWPAGLLVLWLSPWMGPGRVYSTSHVLVGLTKYRGWQTLLFFFFLIWENCLLLKPIGTAPLSPLSASPPSLAAFKVFTKECGLFRALCRRFYEFKMCSPSRAQHCANVETYNGFFHSFLFFIFHVCGLRVTHLELWKMSKNEHTTWWYVSSRPLTACQTSSTGWRAGWRTFGHKIKAVNSVGVDSHDGHAVTQWCAHS